MSDSFGSRKKNEQTLEKLNQVSPSFCLAKWKNSTIHLHNGHTQSCHHVRSQKFDLTFENSSSMHNTTDKINSRNKMLAGKRPSECQYCWKMEDLGQTSDRIIKSGDPIYMNHWREVLHSGKGSHINPSYLEISFDHNCQFACLYCSPAYSTTWEKEVRDHGDYPTYGNFINRRYNQSRTALKKNKREENINAFWNWWPQLKEDLSYLRVTGGEPLLSPHTYKLIHLLSQDDFLNLHFAINSNLGVAENSCKHLIEQLNKLQEKIHHFSFFASIDTVGKRAEYIRFGLDEDLYWTNVHRILGDLQKPITFCFMITINAFSLEGLQELLIRIENLKTSYPQHEIRIDTPVLNFPAPLSVEILTPKFKSFMEECFDWIKDRKTFSEKEKFGLKRIIPMIGKNHKNPAILYLLRQDFARFVNEYDNRKGLCFSDTFPELIEFKKLCENKRENFQKSFLNQERFS